MAIFPGLGRRVQWTKGELWKTQSDSLELTQPFIVEVRGWCLEITGSKVSKGWSSQQECSKYVLRTKDGKRQGVNCV